MWRKVRIGQAADVVSGGTPSRSNPSYWGPGIPWATPSDVTDCATAVLMATHESITDSGLRQSSAKRLPAGSILLTSRATIGEARIAGIEICTNQGFKNLVPRPGYDPTFLYYQVCNLRPKFERYGVGSTFPEINKSDVSRIEFESPSDEDEQRQIGRVLRAIDEQIERTCDLIAKQEQVRAGLMHDLFTRGVDENGRLRPPREEAPRSYYQTELAWLPVGWSCPRVEDLLVTGALSEVQDGNHGELHPLSSDFVREGVPFVMANDLKFGRVDFSNCARITPAMYRRLRVGFSRPNDVFLSHKGTVGRVARFIDEEPEAMLTPQVTLYRTGSTSVLTSAYLYWYFLSPTYQWQLARVSEQSTRSYVGITQQKKLRVVVPSPDELDSIVAPLAKLDHIASEERALHAKLLHLRRGLMQALLTGKSTTTTLAEDRAA